MNHPARPPVILSIALLLPAAPALAQELPEEEEPMMAIRGVELVSPRIEGPPALVLQTEKGKLRPASGTYRTKDRKSLVVKDGRIVEVSDPTGDIGRLRVASVDEVAVRTGWAPDRLVLADSRKTRLVLPDGRYTSESGASIVVRDGAIVGYAEGR